MLSDYLTLSWHFFFLFLGCAMCLWDLSSQSEIEPGPCQWEQESTLDHQGNALLDYFLILNCLRHSLMCVQTHFDKLETLPLYLPRFLLRLTPFLKYLRFFLSLRPFWVNVKLLDNPQIDSYLLKTLLDKFETPPFYCVSLFNQMRPFLACFTTFLTNGILLTYLRRSWENSSHI